MAITKIQSESMNLADTYAFTGTVTGAGVSNTPAFFAYKSSDQALNDATTTKITLESESIDTDGAFASSEFTVPSGKGGRYFLHWSPQFHDGTGKTKNCSGIIKVGSTNKLQAQVDHFGSYAGQYATWVSVTGILTLSAGDVVSFYALADQTDDTQAAVVAQWQSTNPGTWAMGYKID